MKSYREELWVETKSHRAYVNITSQVEAAIKKSGVQEGLVLVNAMHITASVYVNDDEPGEDNDDTHSKRQIMRREVIIAITNGQLDF